MLWAYQSKIGPVHCDVIFLFHLLRFDLDIMTFTLKILSSPLLSLETAWQLLHIFRTHQPYMGPLHCRVISTFSPLILKLWP